MVNRTNSKLIGFNDVECETKMHNILCKIEAQSSSALVTTIRPGIKRDDCPDGWHQINYHCYILVNQTISGSEAPVFCKSRYPGSHLAKFESYDDFLQLKNLLDHNMTSKNVWVN